MKKISTWAKRTAISIPLFILSVSVPLALADNNPPANTPAASTTNLQSPAPSLANIGNSNSNNPPMIIPPAPDVNANAFVLMDANSGIILAEKNMNQKVQPASLTKLMTLYITFEALANGQITLENKARVSSVAWKTGGSRMFLQLGTHVPIKKLIEGIIVASGNDATIALAQYIGGNIDSFVSLMNSTAARLGMSNSHFQDPDGLPMPGHHVTAHDMALLTRDIIINFPQYYPFFNQKWLTWNGIRQPNRNRLLWRDTYVDGLKTGHTQEAGYCLIASGVRHGMRLISVVMGTSSDSERFDDSQALLNWGFRFYNTHQLFSAGQVLKNERVWYGQKKDVKFGVAKNLYVTTPIGQYKNLQANLTLPPIVKAPIIKGKAYGTVIIQLNGIVLAKAPVVALNSDARGHFLSRISDHIALFFQKVS